MNAHTRGTSVDPEVEILHDQWPLLLFGHTLWYRFEGTGEPVTVSTVGSDFNTVIGVYIAAADGFAQVAYGQGSPLDAGFWSPQAETTVQTSEGVTYYVQAGGEGCVGGEYGRLRIEIN